MTIPRILLCMNMLLLVTCSATESHTFKDKLRGLVAYEVKEGEIVKYVFNANTDLTKNAEEIVYHFDSIVSSDTAYYRAADDSGFYALKIVNDEVYRNPTPESSTGGINLGELAPFLVLLTPEELE